MRLVIAVMVRRARTEQRADTLVAAWEAEGDSCGLERMTAAFWDDGTAWMSEQLDGKS